MKKHSLLMTLLASTMVSGCASNFEVSNPNAADEKGFPFRTSIPVKITTVTSYEPKPGPDSKKYKDLCSKTRTESEVAILPLGSLHYVVFDPAQLGKGEFALEFSDSGNVKKISVNSDATAGVDATTNFLEKVLPFFKATEVAEEATDAEMQALFTAGKTAEAMRKEHCIEVSKTIAPPEKLSVVR